MPTASKDTNGVNTGISYPTNSTKQLITQTQSKMYSSDEPKDTKVKSRRDLPPETVATLKAWLFSPEHFTCPYPRPQDQVLLMQKTGMDKKQLKCWFTNARRRIWKPMLKKQLEDGNLVVDAPQLMRNLPVNDTDDAQQLTNLPDAEKDSTLQLQPSLAFTNLTPAATLALTANNTQASPLLTLPTTNTNGTGTSTLGDRQSIAQALLPGGSAPEFLYQLTKMLTTPTHKSIIEWSTITGQGRIEVHAPSELESQILGKYFRHTKYSSFQRQLNYFGFRKIAGNGKMSPCSYINDNATCDIRSLLLMKRKNAGGSGGTRGGDRILKEGKNSKGAKKSPTRRGSGKNSTTTGGAKRGRKRKVVNPGDDMQPATVQPMFTTTTSTTSSTLYGVNTGISSPVVNDTDDAQQLIRISTNLPDAEKDSTEAPLNNGKISSKKKPKRMRRKCSAPNCQNRVVQGGVCITHGAKRKSCSHPGCTKAVKLAGFCSTHGPARKKCETPGCTRVAVQGGKCITHGGKRKSSCNHPSIVPCKKNDYYLNQGVHYYQALGTNDQHPYAYPKEEQGASAMISQGQQEMMRAMSRMSAMAQGGYVYPMQMMPNQAMVMQGQVQGQAMIPMMPGQAQAVPMACQKHGDEELLRQWFQTQFSPTGTLVSDSMSDDTDEGTDNSSRGVTNKLFYHNIGASSTLCSPKSNTNQQVNDQINAPPMMRKISDYTVDDDDMMGAMIYKSSNTAKTRAAEKAHVSGVEDINTNNNPQIDKINTHNNTSMELKNKEMDVLIRAKIVDKLRIKLGCTVSVNGEECLGESHGATRKGKRIGSFTESGTIEMSESITGENGDQINAQHPYAYPTEQQGAMISQGQQEMMRAMSRMSAMAQGGYAYPMQMLPNLAMMPGQAMMMPGQDVLAQQYR